ncbi:MAG TPA: hypothetical protein VK902_23315 [Rubrobacter sp.]|nr:hypothetical protein [Rubrobacter sp.]
MKRSLSLGSAFLFAGGLVVGWAFGQLALGVVLFALGGVLFALRGYLNTGDKVAAGALIFVAVVAVGIQLIVQLLGP